MIETQFKHVINDILYQSFLPNNIVCEDINRKKIDIFDISLNKIDFVIEQETEYAKVVFMKILELFVYLIYILNTRL